MSRHDDVIRLRHMRDHAAEAIAMTRRKKRTRQALPDEPVRQRIAIAM
jgi:hypothetical protein